MLTENERHALAQVSCQFFHQVTLVLVNRGVLKCGQLNPCIGLKKKAKTFHTTEVCLMQLGTLRFPQEGAGRPLGNDDNDDHELFLWYG